MDALQNTGLQEDCPFSLKEGAEPLSPESVAEVSDEAFAEYAGRLNSYLQARGPASSALRWSRTHQEARSAPRRRLPCLMTPMHHKACNGCPADHELSLVPPQFPGLVRVLS